MVRIGLVGVGFMGWIHYLAYKQSAGVKLAGVCTRDERRRKGDWRGIQGNFGPPGEMVDLAGVGQYAELAELLADPNIDLVDLCLPPHVHASATIQALEAGKHVFVEKPMALTTAECERMVTAAKRAGKQLFVGHVLPFLPEYAKARELIDSGQYGRAIGGHFSRVISDPLWLKDFYDPHKVGGPAVDLHVHDAHFILSVFGKPNSLVSQGRMRGEVAEYFTTLFRFADPKLAVSATSGVVNQQGRPFTHGFEIHLERATLLFDFAVMSDGQNQARKLTLLNDQGGVEYPELPAGDPMLAAFVAEVAEVARCVQGGKPSQLLGGELARDAIALCHLQQTAVQLAQPQEFA